MPDISSSDLQVNAPIEAPAPDATLNIAIDPAQPLRLGAYLFQLQVVDDSDNTSSPVTLRVTVTDGQIPIADIRGPSQVNFGTTIRLSGERSRDQGGGTVARFIWTLLDRP